MLSQILTLLGALALLSNAAVPTEATEAAEADSCLVILSFNVREWTRDRDSSQDTYWKTRMEAMTRMISDVNPDIICLQEVLPPVGRYVPEGYKQVGVSVSHPIYIRKSMKASGHHFSVFWEACTVKGIRVVNVHSRWENDIVQRTVSQVNGQITDRTVAYGDWNTSLASIEKAGLNMESARTMLEIGEKDDTFINFTKPEKSHGAIDHFFLKGLKPLAYRMITDGYGCSRISDHYPIVLTVAL